MRAVYFTTMCIFIFIHVVRRLYPRQVRNDFNKDVYINKKYFSKRPVKSQNMRLHRGISLVDW